LSARDKLQSTPVRIVLPTYARPGIPRVNLIVKLKLKNPWRDSLIIATGLSALVFTSSELWQAGQAEWGFVLLFVTAWLLIGLFLANDGFNEESGVILAQALDDNVDHLHERIRQLEQELASRDDSGYSDETEAVTIQ